MRNDGPRSFECEVTGEPCTDRRCSRTHCCERVRLETLEHVASETAVDRSRQEIARKIVSELISKKTGP